MTGTLTTDATSYVTTSHAVTITDTATLSQLHGVDAATTGALIYAGITGVAIDYASVTGTLTTDATNYVTGSHAVTITDAATLAQLTRVDAATIGVFTYSGVTGVASDYASVTGTLTTRERSLRVLLQILHRLTFS